MFVNVYFADFSYPSFTTLMGSFAIRQSLDLKNQGELCQFNHFKKRNKNTISAGRNANNFKTKAFSSCLWQTESWVAIIQTIALTN